MPQRPRTSLVGVALNHHLDLLYARHTRDRIITPGEEAEWTEWKAVKNEVDWLTDRTHDAGAALGKNGLTDWVADKLPELAARHDRLDWEALWELVRRYR